MMRANRTHVFIYIAGSRIAPIIIYSANNCLTGTVDCAIPIRSAYNYIIIPIGIGIINGRAGTERLLFDPLARLSS
jgi:hypothetical protein